MVCRYVVFHHYKYLRWFLVIYFLKPGFFISCWYFILPIFLNHMHSDAGWLSSGVNKDTCMIMFTTPTTTYVLSIIIGVLVRPLYLFCRSFSLVGILDFIICQSLCLSVLFIGLALKFCAYLLKPLFFAIANC